MNRLHAAVRRRANTVASDLSAMPHFRQLPGRLLRISGRIGQV